MPLKLILGPPNSGRAGLALAGLRSVLDAGPVLVVPTFDDVDSFERELSSRGAVLGATVTTFDGSATSDSGLFAMVATAAGSPPAPRLTPAQRLRAIEVGVAEAGERLGPLRRSAARPGFAKSLELLLGELQSAGVSPSAVEAGAETLEGSAFLGDLATLFAAYEEVRRRTGRIDAHDLANEALGTLAGETGAWRRPVFVYGFDDLTGNQLELLRLLSAATEVTASFPHESGREGLGIRPELLARLRDVGAVEETVTAADPANTPTPLLFALERGFGVAAAEPVEPDGGLGLLRSAGARGEAEAIAAAVVRRLHEGEPAEEVAVIFRDPARRGPLLARVLESYGVPAALEASLPVATSGLGGALLALLEAEFGTGRAADALRWLRGPSGVRPGKVDWLERAVRVGRAQSAAETWGLWSEKWGELPEDLRRVREAGPGIAAAVGEIATRFLARDGDAGEDPSRRAERQAAAAIAAAMSELSELGELAPGPVQTIALLRGLDFRAWSGPVEGRVRIASPERLRADRLDHVVIGSLQDGEFPRRGRGDSFLSEAQRESLGLDPRRDDDAYESYLFYASFSRARLSVTLSYRDCDEAGGAEARSPLVDEVRRLLTPAPPAEGADPLEEALGGGRGLAEPVFGPAEAPSEDELARAVAALPAAEAEAGLDLAGVPGEVRERVAARVTSARATEEATRAPGPLSVPAVIESLRAVPAYGGTTLEEFDRCSYRWFVDHELAPRPLGPMPDAIEQGGLMHEVLERLYGEKPGDSPIPLPATVGEWVERGRALVGELSAARKLGDRPAERAIRRGVERLLVRFLGEEARRGAGDFLPWRLEAKFGEDGDSERPPLEIDGWKLHGAIDRLDRDPHGRALVHDYKVASKVSPAGKLEEDAKLQLQLYLLAAERLWDLAPGGAVYHPLRGTTERRPRGLVLEDVAEEMETYPLVGTDVLERDEFDAILEEARSRAGRIVARMREGEIRRDPGPRPGLRNHDVCPRFCDFAPICRRDRAPVVEDEREQDER